jgi:hypothetical protein
LGHKAKWEYFRAVYEGYRKAGREAKQVMLNEFCLNPAYNRKYAIRRLNGPPPGKPGRHQRPLPPRAALVAEPVPALREAGEESSRGIETATR